MRSHLQIINIEHLELILVQFLNLMILNPSNLILFIINFFILNQLLIASVSKSNLRNYSWAETFLLFEKLQISFQDLKHVSVDDLDCSIVGDLGENDLMIIFNHAYYAVGFLHLWFGLSVFVDFGHEYELLLLGGRLDK